MLVMHQFLMSMVSICLLHYILNCMISLNTFFSAKKQIKDKKNEIYWYNHIWTFGQDPKPKPLIKIRKHYGVNPHCYFRK